jgi:DNA-directed RNA polymerase II subunit RPB2
MRNAIAAEYEKHKVVAPLLDIPTMTFEEWKAYVQVKATSLFLPVASLVHTHNVIISDITVESENHSFIGGGGFTVSNSAMGKQAVGIYMSNFNQRIDTMAHVLNYPQKPLVRTRLSKYTYSDELPSGINAVVAIMTHTGFNQEDSVMVNKSAIDRGLFTSTYYKSYRDQCSKNHSTGEEEIFCKPDDENTAHMKPYNYNKLGDDGFVPKNTSVNGNDILIGKIMPHKVQGVIHPRDTSHVLKANDDGYVDMNYTGVNGEAYKFAKVRLRKYRKPVIGDKLASRSAQKGSCGMVYNHQDMPFSKSGIVPDLIMNPHAIPSRMTIGQLMECIMGKAACHIGSLGDSTPFTDCSVEDIASILEKSGMERYGNEILYNGRTGEMIQTEIFIGPTYYQRLKHMVADKAHVRGGNGPVVMLTRQPAEGRARNGGLRFGEMERDAIVAHGASAFLKERMLDTSDNYRVFICRKCGLICTANPEKNIYKCSQCKNNADITQVRIPYSMKLLMQELMTMGVAPRISI